MCQPLPLQNKAGIKIMATSNHEIWRQRKCCRYVGIACIFHATLMKITSYFSAALSSFINTKVHYMLLINILANWVFLQYNKCDAQLMAKQQMREDNQVFFLLFLNNKIELCVCAQMSIRMLQNEIKCIPATDLYLLYVLVFYFAQLCAIQCGTAIRFYSN